MPARPVADASDGPGPAARRRVRLDQPLDLALTLSPLHRGRLDPTMALHGTRAWRASRTPEGPATLRLDHDDAGSLAATAWGPGAGWALAHVEDLIGEADDLDGFAALLAATDTPATPLLDRLRRTFPGWRLPRSAQPVDALVPSVLEQRVTGRQARRSYRQLTRRLSEPAPVGDHMAPGDLWLPPDPARLARTPYWVLHRMDIDGRRAQTLQRVARHHRRLDETVALPLDEARRRLAAVPGVGPWTVAEVAAVAFGDADAVSVGDYHLRHQVVCAFTGRARGSDAEMLELLAPFAGHRGRVARLVARGGPTPPSFGPRQRIVPISSY